MLIAAFSRDPGPTKYLESLASACESIEIFPSEYVFHQLISTCVENHCVNLLLTGTCLGEGIDKSMLRYGRDHNIITVSVIDHWSWYRERFEVGNKLLLPDIVIVNDQIAHQQALLAGLPRSRVVALGNPILEKLSRISINQSTYSIRSRYNHIIPTDKKLIVFVSEQLRADFPYGSHNFLGYDEYVVISLLISNLSHDEHLLIKLHPVEQDNKYSFVTDSRVTVIRDVPVQDLAFIGDVIVGMLSMLLLELAMFRNDIISLRPGAKTAFIGERLGATLDAKSIDEFNHIVKCKKMVSSDYRKRFIGSTDRIISFLLNKSK
jgi:hypothetical protein